MNSKFATAYSAMIKALYLFNDTHKSSLLSSPTPVTHTHTHSAQRSAICWGPLQLVTWPAHDAACSRAIWCFTLANWTLNHQTNPQWGTWTSMRHLQGGTSTATSGTLLLLHQKRKVPMRSCSSCKGGSGTPKCHCCSQATSAHMEGKAWHTVAVSEDRKNLAMVAKEAACC